LPPGKLLVLVIFRQSTGLVRTKYPKLPDTTTNWLPIDTITISHQYLKTPRDCKISYFFVDLRSGCGTIFLRIRQNSKSDAGMTQALTEEYEKT
jgi:hypothetical protein